MENYTPRAPRPAMSAEAKDTAEPAVTPTTRSFSAPAAKKKQPKKWWKWAMAAVVVALVAGAGWFFLRSTLFGNNVDSSKYQAVFLTSGQVYFGKLQFLNDDYMKLTDVFYIQSSTTDSESDNPQKSKTDSNNMQLIKLGNEIHGPDDAMVISRDQVLFYENLKSDGKVTQSIQQYKTENK